MCRVFFTKQLRDNGPQSRASKITDSDSTKALVASTVYTAVASLRLMSVTRCGDGVTQGRSQDFTLGPQKLKRENRGAEGGEDWEGCPLPNRLGGVGECRELPQRGPGQSPGRQRIFRISEAHRTLLVERIVPSKPVFFLKIPSIYDWGEACPTLATSLVSPYIFSSKGDDFLSLS